MHKLSFAAIGTNWYIEIFEELERSRLGEVSSKIAAICEDFEVNYSRFRKNSLISKLNDLKKIRGTTELLELLELGAEAREVTDGHFDIAVASALENLGYDANYSFTERDQDYEKTVFISGKGDKSEISLSQNTRIDLGGIGKGFLIDKVAKLLKNLGVKYYFINAGGDIFCTSDSEEPIVFGLQNPFNKREIIGKVSLKNQALAASGTSKRAWKTKNTGKQAHHLIDMQSGESVDSTQAVFVEGATATAADIASTAIFVSPRSRHTSIATHYDIAYMLVFPDKKFTKSINFTEFLPE